MIEHGAKLTTKTINELCFGLGDENKKQICFHIPTYQRGYRWDSHVVKLLDDLLEYHFDRKMSSNVGDYYCLQPIIIQFISEDDDAVHYKVVDGQQRLTTIYILLKLYLLKSDNPKMFQLIFERDNNMDDEKKTRKYFIDNIDDSDVTVNTDKIDCYYFKNAYTSAESWTTKKANELEDNSFRSKMQTIISSDTRVIWYELDDDADARSIFRHINDGKIELTSSELIKAMLLNSRHYLLTNIKDADVQNKVIRIGQEKVARLWDEIEISLQNDEFWNFICPKRQERETRIDYIFDLFYAENSPDYKPSQKEIDSTLVFDYFEKLLKDGSVVDETSKANFVWESVKDYYRTFYDWFTDITIYNYVGYLVHYRKAEIIKINLLKKIYKSHTKELFLKKLRAEIKKDLDISNLESLSYEDDRKKIERTLVVYNIETMNVMKRRFVFADDDQKDSWSVEHIFALNSQNISQGDRVNWIKGYIDVVDSAIQRSDEETQKDLKKLRSKMKKFTDEDQEFDELFDEILEKLERRGSDPDSIANLALIEKRGNSTLSNLPFYRKRQKIVEMLEEGRSIPQCTVNVFMKFYSGIGTNLDFWSSDDGEAYLENMNELLRYFFTKEGK